MYAVSCSLRSWYDASLCRMLIIALTSPSHLCQKDGIMPISKHQAASCSDTSVPQHLKLQDYIEHSKSIWLSTSPTSTSQDFAYAACCPCSFHLRQPGMHGETERVAAKFSSLKSPFVSVVQWILSEIGGDDEMLQLHCFLLIPYRRYPAHKPQDCI